MEIFSYSFMVRAFIVAILISVITPLIGSTIVLKRLSAVGDALSHSGLAGVAIGLAAGFNPVISAVVFSVLASLLMEFIRRIFPKYSELSTAIVMSFAVGLTAVVSGFVKKAVDFNSFLFGSIVAITDLELYTVAALCALVIFITFLLRRELFYIAFDEENAEIDGVRTSLVNFIFTVLTAVTVAVASRTVGALIISSLMVLPTACSMLISKSYKSNMLLSLALAIAFTVCGLFISYYANLKPGGTIVLIAVFVLLAIIAAKKIMKIT